MFDWIDPLYGWLGLGTISVAGLFVIAYFVPPLRNAAIAAAGVIMAAAAVYAKGSRDATKSKQAEWDKAEKKSIERGEKAHSDAKRDVSAGKVKDKFDRDI